MEQQPGYAACGSHVRPGSACDLMDWQENR